MATQQGVPSGRGPRAGSRPKPTGEDDEAEDRDELHGLVSVLYHALEGAQAYAGYSREARRAGDADLLEFFEECQEEEIDRAERAKQLLALRLEGYAEEEGEYDEEEEEDEEELDDEDH